ncbi:MAG: T9SS type A sorting domain-containing protein [Bacteroidota bacterium]
MKLSTFLTTLLFSFLLAANGKAQLISHTFMGDWDLDDLDMILEDFDPPQGLLNLDFEVEAWKLTYNTPAPDGSMTTATGAIVIPKGYTCPLPLANYNHGTVHHATGVPSHFSTELNVGLLFASMGYVVTLPDYIGLGDSPFPYHPYIHGESHGMTTVNMLRAARELSDILSFELNDQLFLFGYSQGGYAAMASHKMIQEQFSDEFTVTASAPMSGPYDVSGAQTIYITGDNPYPTPGYLPYVLLAYNEIYDLLDNLDEALVEPYLTTLPPIFFDKTATMGDFNNACPDVPNQILVPELLQEFETENDHFFRVRLQENDVHDWTPSSPMFILGCNGDDQVSFNSAINAHANFVANGAPDVSINDFGPFDHGGCVEFCLIAGKFFFDGKRDLTNGMELSFDITEESSVGAMDGSITVTATGGAGNYDYMWDDGTNGQTISGLSNSETFTITVMDDLGCSISEDITLELSTSVFTADSRPARIFPNPASSNVVIEIPASSSAYDLVIRDMTGKVVRQYEGLSQGNFIMERNGLQNGVYLVELNGDKRLHGKLMFF